MCNIKKLDLRLLSYSYDEAHVLTSMSCFFNMEAINEMVENEEPHDLIMDRIVKEEFLKPEIEMAWHSGIWWYENEISKPKIFAFYAMLLTYLSKVASY